VPQANNRILTVPGVGGTIWQSVVETVGGATVQVCLR